MEVVHLDEETSRDELTLRNKTAWNVRQYQGGWIRGVTAGGCRNNVGKETSYCQHIHNYGGKK